MRVHNNQRKVSMKLTTYQSDRGPRVAGLYGTALVDVNDSDPALPSCPKALLARGWDVFPRIQRALAVGRPVPLETMRLLPPIPNPEKIVCAGLNYADHARETDMPLPAEPVLFNKFPTAVAADGQAIVLPRASREVDYEAELVVVVGQGGRHIKPENARRHIAAYCCGNDVSARDWQLRKPGGQWLLGKSFDGFAPFGPWLVTADAVPDVGRLAIELRLNGHTMQRSNTSQWIFAVDALVSYVSGVCTLSPGDLIFTGTPSGVGFARRPPVFLQPGDRVEVEIEGLGVLTNPVVAE
jgi:2-keto-4-pentenoate hydratase/2-oxohepta-3-ene-1,7-dioic acid hydratase in catechol pathway